MTPDPRIAEIKKRLAAATPGPMLNILSAGTPTDFEPTTRTLSTYKLAVIATKVRDGDAALFAHAQIDLAFLLSDRERAIDEAVKGERERCAKIAETQVEIYKMKKQQAWDANLQDRWDRFENYRDAAQYIVDGIRRTESGG